MSAAACWFALRLTVLEPIIWMEESERWKHEETEQFLGEKYVLFPLVVEAGNMGWFGCSKRYFCVGFHRVYVVNIYGSLRNVVPLFSRDRGVDWDCIMLAHTEK